MTINRFHWHRRDHQDMIRLKNSLPLEAYGAVSVLLDHIYEGQKWPSDTNCLTDEYCPIHNWLGVSRKKWTSLRELLIRKEVLVSRDGKLIVPMVEQEFENFLLRQQKASENAAKIRQKLRENRKKDNDFNETSGLQEEPHHKSPLSRDQQSDRLRQIISKCPQQASKVETKKLKNWVWTEGTEAFMTIHELQYKEAKNRIGKLLSSYDEKYIIAAQTICHTAKSFLKDPDRFNINVETSTEFDTTSVTRIPRNSEAGRLVMELHEQEFGCQPELMDGFFQVSPTCLKAISDIADKRRAGNA